MAGLNKPKLLIKVPHKQNQLYLIEKDLIQLGRSEECDVILPNVSISRIHAVIEFINNQFVIKDHGSQNGFRHNTKQSTEAILQSGDEIQIGIFSIVFLGDSPQDNYYRGRSVSYLPKYDPKSFASTEEATFIMSKREQNIMARTSSLLYHGCITTSDNRFFYPEENPLTFGKNAIIGVDHWWVFGVVAEITWNNKEHRIQKTSWLCPVRVNGINVQEGSLRVGDKIQIGNSEFHYRLRDGI